MDVLLPSGRGENNQHSVQRVQVQARLNVAAGTLRVGSSDGGHTIHQDEDQEMGVLHPLCQRFHLRPTRLTMCQQIILHEYASHEAGTSHAGARTRSNKDVNPAYRHLLLRVREAREAAACATGSDGTLNDTRGGDRNEDDDEDEDEHWLVLIARRGTATGSLERALHASLTPDVGGA